MSFSVAFPTTSQLLLSLTSAVDLDFLRAYFEDFVKPSHFDRKRSRPMRQRMTSSWRRRRRLQSVTRLRSPMVPEAVTCSSQWYFVNRSPTWLPQSWAVDETFIFCPFSWTSSCPVDCWVLTQLSAATLWVECAEGELSGFKRPGELRSKQLDEAEKNLESYRSASRFWS